MLSSITYPPIPIFEVGPLRLSLHGLMAGVGFIVGAILMLREARRRGFDEVKISSVLTWALIGSILGARLFTVPAHLDEGIIEALQPFKSFSIMGGFAGGIIVGGLRMRMLGLNVLAHMDMASFGLAIGAVVGRIGDLFIVEHLGGRTDFFLGYAVKPGYQLAPQHGGPVSGPGSVQGLECTAAQAGPDGVCGVYHHAGLYDLLGAAVLLGVLYLVARRWSTIRYGALIFLWAAWYGFQRFFIDFTRNTELVNADATAGPFTWSQWTGLASGVVSGVILVWIGLRKKTPVVSSEQDRAYGAASPAS